MAIVRWNVDADGFWDVAANWREDGTGANRVPDINDDVIIDRGAANPTVTIRAEGQAAKSLRSEEAMSLPSGSLTLGGDSQINHNFTINATLNVNGKVGGVGPGTVQLQNGTLTAGASGSLDFPAGRFVWTGGTIQGGSAGIVNTGEITLAGANSKTLTGVLINRGTIRHADLGPLAINAGVLENRAGALYDLQGDGGFSLLGSSPSTVINVGTFRKSAGAGTSSLNTNFHNQGGTIDVRSGTLALANTSTLAEGDFVVASGATFNPASFTTTTVTGTLTGAGGGTVLLATGTLAANGATFNFPAELFKWTDGTLNGGGAGVTNTGVINLVGTSGKTLNGKLINAATINHWDSGSLGLNFGTLENRAGALYDLQSDAGFSLFGSNPSAVINAGTFRKSAGDGTSSLNTNFQNQGGAFDVRSGTLALANTSTLAGGNFVVASGATFNPASFTTTTVTGTLSGTGGGTVLLVNGTLSASGATVNFPAGLFKWAGGTLDGGGAGVTNTGVINLVGTSGKTLNGKLINAATINHRDSGSLGINVGTVENRAGALYDLQSDAGFSLFGSNPSAVINAGTFRKSVGDGTSSLNTNFQNQGGAFDVRSGTLALANTSTLAGGNFVVASGATFNPATFATTTVTGTLTGAGGGAVLLANGTLSASGATFNFPAELFKWTGGTLDGGSAGVTNTGVITLLGTSGKTLTSTLINAGTINQRDSGPLGINLGTVENRAGAVYDLQSDAGFSLFGSNPSAVINAGTFRKSAGAGTSFLNTSFDNRGIVEAASGVMQFGQPLTTSGAIHISDDATLSVQNSAQQTGGQILLDGGTLAAFTLTMQGGSLIGNGTVAADVNNVGGAISPGFSAGELTITGSYTQGASGRLLVELGGSEAGEFDRLNVGGVVTLNGALVVSPLAGFVPASGDTFQVINNTRASAVAGAFAGFAEGATTAVGRVTYVGGTGNDVMFFPNQLGPNSAPTISNIANQAINEDAAASVPFTISDAQWPADALFVSVRSSNTTLTPESGIQITGAGANRTLQIKPAPNQSGVSTITVEVRDGSLTSTDTFVLTVRPINDPPILEAPQTLVAILEDAPRQTVNLRGIAAGGGESQALRVTATSSNAALIPHPTVTYVSPNSTGLLTYQPAANQNGTATITVTVRDAGLDGIAGNADDGVTSRSFEVRVIPVDDPIAADVALTSAADSPDPVVAGGNIAYTINFVNRGPDAAGSVTITDAVPANTTFVSASVASGAGWTAATPPANGTGNIVFAKGSVANGETATFRVVVNVNAGTPTGATITNRATVTTAVNDPNSANNTATASTVVAPPPNTRPTISNIANRVTPEDSTTGAIAFTVGDSQTAPGALTVTATSSNTTLVPNNAASLTLGGSGANRSLTIRPVANRSGTATITIVVSDGSLTASDTFVLTVNPVNDAPSLANPIPDVTANENSPNKSINLASFFADLDLAASGDVLTFSVESNTNSALVTPALSGATATLKGATLTLDYLPDQSGVADITIRATDSAGAFVRDTFRVAVVPDNPVSVANPIADVTESEDAANRVISLANVFTHFNAANLTLSLRSNSAPSLVATALNGANLTLDFQPEQNGTAQITVRATDPSGAFAEDTFPVIVQAVNDRPVLANSIADVMAERNDPDTILDLSQVFRDVDIATNNDRLTLRVRSNSNSSLIVPTITGTQLRLDYQANLTGVANITVRAEDQSGAFVEDTLRVNVVAGNVPPTLANPTRDVSVNEDAPNTVVSLANVFADADGDLLTLSVFSNSNPSLVQPSWSGTSLTLDYLANRNGVAQITIRATEPSGAFVDDTLQVTVRAVNDPPVVANPIADVTLNEAQPNKVIELSGVFADVDGDNLTIIQPANSGQGVAFTLNGTRLTVSSQLFQSEIVQVTVGARDPAGAFVTDTFQVTVQERSPPPNRAPVAANDLNYTTNQDGVLRINAPQGVLANDTDADGHPLTAVLVTRPANGSLTLNADGSVGYTPRVGFVGADTFTYKANDGRTDSNVATARITVNAVGPGPGYQQAPTLGDFIQSHIGQTNVTRIDDFTRHTYSIRATQTGTVADFLVQRTFARPIQGLKVTLVAGVADDIGYVGSMLVANGSRNPCRVGRVETPIDVTSQVTTSGNTASLTLRAIDACGVNVGWGPDQYRTGDPPATFHWEVTLAPPPTVSIGHQAYDNFTFAVDTLVTGVQWRGTYARLDRPELNPPAPNTGTWNVSFWSDSAGRPGNPIQSREFSGSSVSRTPVTNHPAFHQGSGHGGFTQTPSSTVLPRINLYDFQVSLPTPFLARAGTTYWLSPTSLAATSDPAFHWLSGSGGNSRSAHETAQGRIMHFDSKDRAFTLITRPAIQDDGVPDAIENNAPNSGDGNRDGIADRLQNNVASLPNSRNGFYVTLESPGGTTLADVAAIANPAPDTAPPSTNFGLGFFEFNVNNVSPGKATTVTLTLPPNIRASSYWKYGPTPDNTTPHWYEFLFDGTTGAEFTGTTAAPKIVLHFVDGKRGDDDLLANGIVVDDGAPVLDEAPATVSIEGSEEVVRGQPISLTLRAEDPDSADTAADLTFHIDWDGDEVIDEAVTGPPGVEVQHIFPASGAFLTHIVAIDQDGAESAAAVHGITVHDDRIGALIGPVGVGEQRFIPSPEAMPYTIEFQNIAGAPTAVRELVVNSRLDPDLDPTTFELGDMSLGDITIDVPAGQQSFITRLDLRNRLGVFVDVAAGIDLNTGDATWAFRAIDPVTGDLVADPLLGFLPPNYVAPQGQGFVTYTARPRGSLASGAAIEAQATLLFDGSPRDTVSVTNTLDVSAPTSAVLALPQVIDTPEFEVTWSGADDARGSGVASYDIFVSVDGGPFEVWLDDTTLTSAFYEGQAGRTYAFYSIAVDQVGFAEGAPSAADAQTRVESLSWTNEPDEHDVNDDGDMNLADVLAVVQFLRARGNSFELPPPDLALSPPPFVDVNQDGIASLADVLAVVQELRARLFAQPQAEGEIETAPALATSLPYMGEDDDKWNDVLTQIASDIADPCQESRKRPSSGNERDRRMP